jgi:hypothetical protein
MAAQIFLRTLEHRAPDPSEICAFDFKGKIRRFKIFSVSETIGIDRSIFLNSLSAQASRFAEKIPSVSPTTTSNGRGFKPVILQSSPCLHV